MEGFINLDSNLIDNVSNLIKRKLFDKNENIHPYNENICSKCENNTFVEAHKAFLNSPPFLLIDFEVFIKNQKNLEDKINLGDYILTNIGPKTYVLYGFICEDQ